MDIKMVPAFSICTACGHIYDYRHQVACNRILENVGVVVGANSFQEFQKKIVISKKMKARNILPKHFFVASAEGLNRNLPKLHDLILTLSVAWIDGGDTFAENINRLNMSKRCNKSKGALTVYIEGLLEDFSDDD